MEAPTDVDKCLAILVLRRAGCSQDMAASIMHCAKLRIGEVENWFSKQLPYLRAVELCNETAIKGMIDIDLVPREEVGKKLLEKVTQITPDIILRHYRQDHLLPAKWQKNVDLAVRLQISVSNISAKDWAIWGLHDAGQPPLTSEAGLILWMDRGKLVVKLAVEQDKRFPLFIAGLKNSFPEFKSYDEWRESLTGFVNLCWALAQEVLSRAENETGLNLSPIPVMGKGHLLNVPKFIYEFALDNYASEKQPDLEILQQDPYRYRLVPGELPHYVLAISSKDEMERCKKVTISLTGQYVKDERIGEIIARALQLEKQTAPFQAALSTLIKEASGDG
ncbi:MAG: hypothetical protein V1932_08125 [Chloroflexota bacterium]